MSQPTPTEPSGQRETAAEIEAAAANWVARADRGPLSSNEEIELRDWADADPRRAGAYARALAINLHLDRVVALGQDFPSQHEQVAAPLRRQMMAAAAVAGILSVAGGGFYFLKGDGEDRGAPSIETAKGSFRQLALAEGSAVTLNTMTKVRPRLNKAERRIDLERGEALFHVVKDPNRPFIVYAGELSVRAIGTVFSVRRLGDDAIKVLVTEGIVEISRGAEILGRVHAGIEFAVESAATPVVTNRDPAQVARALAWQRGRLDLQGMTLAEAAAEFSRYSDLTIRVDDRAIADLRIAGVYATSDPEGFARAAALSLGLTAVRRGTEVHIFRS